MNVEKLSSLYTSEVAKVVFKHNMTWLIITVICLLSVILITNLIYKSSKKKLETNRDKGLIGALEYKGSIGRLLDIISVSTITCIGVLGLLLFLNLESKTDGIYKDTKEYNNYLTEYVHPYMIETEKEVDFKGFEMEKTIISIFDNANEYAYRVKAEFKGGTKVSRIIRQEEVKKSETGKSYLKVYKLDKNIEGVLKEGYLHFELYLTEDSKYY